MRCGFSLSQLIPSSLLLHNDITSDAPTINTLFKARSDMLSRCTYRHKHSRGALRTSRLARVGDWQACVFFTTRKRIKQERHLNALFGDNIAGAWGTALDLSSFKRGGLEGNELRNAGQVVKLSHMTAMGRACSGDRATSFCAAANTVQWFLTLLPISTNMAPGTLASETTKSQVEW